MTATMTSLYKHLHHHPRMRLAICPSGMMIRMSNVASCRPHLEDHATQHGRMAGWGCCRTVSGPCLTDHVLLVPRKTATGDGVIILGSCLVLFLSFFRIALADGVGWDLFLAAIRRGFPMRQSHCIGLASIIYARPTTRVAKGRPDTSKLSVWLYIHIEFLQIDRMDVRSEEFFFLGGPGQWVMVDG